MHVLSSTTARHEMLTACITLASCFSILPCLASVLCWNGVCHSRHHPSMRIPDVDAMGRHCLRHHNYCPLHQFLYPGLYQGKEHLQVFLYLSVHLQIQFVMGITHAIQSLVVGCDFPDWMHWALIFYAFTILMLFLNFYFHAYIKAQKRKVITVI